MGGLKRKDVGISNQYVYQTSSIKILSAIVIVFVWLLDLQLHMQSVPITTKVVSLNHTHGEVYLIQLYVINIREI